MEGLDLLLGQMKTFDGNRPAGLEQRNCYYLLLASIDQMLDSWPNLGSLPPPAHGSIFNDFFNIYHSRT